MSHIEDKIKKTKTKQMMVIPLAILLASALVFVALVLLKPKALKEVAEPRLPVVSIQSVEKQKVTIPVYSRGTIKAGTDIPLISEVQGRIRQISKNFESGAYFKKGEKLLVIDDTNYKLDLAKAKSQVSKAKLNLTKVKADVKSNRLSQSSVGKARVEEASSQLEAARADYTRAKLLLERTTITAPFDGRVREKLVDVSQFVTPGVQLGSIFTTDRAEIRLPLSDAQLELIKLPMQGNSDESKNPRIILRGEYAGHEYFWYGEIVRSEGGINQRNRLLHVIAEIENPFGEDKEQPNRPPLAVGKFVEVEIEGSEFDDVVVIPREILRNTNQVLTLTDENRIDVRNVDVMHRGKEKVYIRNGLKSGDWVVSTQLDVVVDGMKVQLADNQKIKRRPSLTPDVKEEVEASDPQVDLMTDIDLENDIKDEEKTLPIKIEDKVLIESEAEVVKQEVVSGQPPLIGTESLDEGSKQDMANLDAEQETKDSSELKTELAEAEEKMEKSDESEAEGSISSDIILRESDMPVTLLESE